MDFELINKSDALGGPGGLDTAAPAASVPSDGIDKTLPSSVVDATPGKKKKKKDSLFVWFRCHLKNFLMLNQKRTETVY